MNLPNLLTNLESSTSTGLVTWIETIQLNLKWSFTLIIRSLAITITIVAILFFLKITHAIQWLKTSINEPIQIEEISEEVISGPDISYKDDIKDIDAVLDLLENKKIDE